MVLITSTGGKVKSLMLDLGISNSGQDLEGKKLQFRTNNRPARRYLYFRFLLTYFYAKQKGLKEFTDKVESCSDFWGSPGEYIEHSSLELLTRNLGVRLPPTIPCTIERNTFDGHASNAEMKEKRMLAPAAAVEILSAEDEGQERWEEYIRPHWDDCDDEVDSDSNSK